MPKAAFAKSLCLLFLVTACEGEPAGNVDDHTDDPNDPDNSDSGMDTNTTDGDTDTNAASDTSSDTGSDSDTDGHSTCFDPIAPKPASLSTDWSKIYTFTRYLKIEGYNIHVLGTASVSDWMMRESCRFIESVVSTFKNSEDQAKMSGHKAYLTTMADPPINDSGQRNGGGKLISLFCEDPVCAIGDDGQYRPWTIPAHELGHSIEYNLGLTDESDALYSAHIDNWDVLPRELFAWGTERWFASRKDGTDRDDMPSWEYDYFSTVFDAGNNWLPACTR
ncbi:MAG: hypothetical protein MUC50_13745 [Myxococcota bacterium]|jgi:hypothetical protein|nr:hypothetical protein [Myxococcota bacterium]